MQSQCELWRLCCIQWHSLNFLAHTAAGVKLAAFKPFTSAANALEQINAVSESQVGLLCWGGKEPMRHGQPLEMLVAAGF